MTQEDLFKRLGEDEFVALRKFAIENGKMWKSKLSLTWATERNSEATLRRTRNILGPSGLYQISNQFFAQSQSEFDLLLNWFKLDDCYASCDGKEYQEEGQEPFDPVAWGWVDKNGRP